MLAESVSCGLTRYRCAASDSGQRRRVSNALAVDTRVELAQCRPTGPALCASFGTCDGLVVREQCRTLFVRSVSLSLKPQTA
jgi:hypothetical protein